MALVHSRNRVGVLSVTGPSSSSTSAGAAGSGLRQNAVLLLSNRCLPMLTLAELAALSDFSQSQAPDQNAGCVSGRRAHIVPLYRRHNVLGDIQKPD